MGVLLLYSNLQLVINLTALMPLLINSYTQTEEVKGCLRCYIYGDRLFREQIHNKQSIFSFPQCKDHTVSLGSQKKYQQQLQNLIDFSPDIKLQSKWSQQCLLTTSTLTKYKVPNIGSKKFLDFGQQSQNQDNSQINLSLESLEYEEKIKFQQKLDLTEIANKTEINRTLEQQALKMVSLLSQNSHRAKKFIFKPRRTEFLKNFEVIDNMVTYTSNEDKLMQIVSDQPLSMEERQQVKIKIMKAKNQWIYFGLVHEAQSKKVSSAQARDSSTISYKITGGKSLYALSECKKVQKIEQNSELSFVIDYKNNKVQWYSEDKQIITLENINFQGKKWYPFITFKFPGDCICLL